MMLRDESFHFHLACHHHFSISALLYSAIFGLEAGFGRFNGINRNKWKAS